MVITVQVMDDVATANDEDATNNLNKKSTNGDEFILNDRDPEHRHYSPCRTQIIRTGNMYSTFATIVA